MLRPVCRRPFCSTGGTSSLESRLCIRNRLLFSFFSTSNYSWRKMKKTNIKNKDVGDVSAARNRGPSRPAGSIVRQQDKESYESPASARTQISPQTVIPQHTGIPKSLTGDTTQEYKTDAKLPPFDICKAIGGLVILKKSLFEMRREERKGEERAKNGPQNVYLRPGMVLLKRFITHPNQVKIIKKCQELGVGIGGFYKPGYNDGNKLHLKMMCLGMNWDPQSRLYDKIRPFDGAEPPKIPLDFSNLVTEAIQSCRSFLSQIKKDANEVPQMEPDICIVNFYDNSGRLGLHQDKDESEESCLKGLPVVSLSLGDSAEFLYGDDRNVDNASKVLLESGDVLIFGGKSRLIYHGVKSICSRTSPKLLIEETNMRPGRLNLTFRKY